MNVIVNNEFFQTTDKTTLFEEEDCYILDDSVTLLPNLLVTLGLYKTTSEARRAGRVGELPKGWSVIQGNKLTTVWVWNPFM